MGWLQQFAAPCLLAGFAVSSAGAAGVRAGKAVASRNLQEVEEVSTSMGCFQDDRRDRRLPVSHMNDTEMTPQKCNGLCIGYSFYALQYGKECWCGGSNADYAKLGALEDTACDMECAGDATQSCGGYNAFDLFQYAEVTEPDGDDNCYADNKSDRVFEDKNTDAALTAESCKALCSEDSTHAFYGLQYGVECWCGVATDDYTRHGRGNCNYPCGGDSASMCGGYTAMNIFPMDETATATPTTAPPTVIPTTPPPTTANATETPTTAPPTTAAPTLANSTVPPTTAAPTVANTTASPTTAAPSTITVNPGAVLVDLVPCIISDAEISEATSGPFVMQQFFKGYWTAKTEEFFVSGTDSLAPLLSDSSGSPARGYCNAVYVGIAATDAQRLELATYSAQFKVRVVYFDTTLTFDNNVTMAKLGAQAWFEGDLQNPAGIQLTTAGGALASVTKPDLKTDPTISNLFTYPVRKTSDVAGVEVLAEYIDDGGAAIISDTFPSAPLISYKSETDGSEELYVFFPIAWFDAESWAWAHYFHEWASKGVFMGERRFYLGAVVDDLFLATPEWVYSEVEDENAVGTRCTYEDMATLKAAQDGFNAAYGSDIHTEFAFNGGGILEKVDSPYTPLYIETAVTEKGTKWFEDDQPTVQDINWLANSIPNMQQNFAAGAWDDDDLLQYVLENLDQDDFYHQSHSLIHLSRDQLRASDCNAEDAGNVQIALMTGMWNSPYYNWRSMVSPGITGLFNEFCLKSGADNLMTCYPGDNTFDGSTPGKVLLINENEPYHSIYTTVDTNGYDGVQIVPRFATFVYFNCVSGDCLVKENESIRRDVCNCENLNPDEDKGECSPTEENVEQCTTTDDDGNTVTDIQSFQSIQEVFDTEAATTTRYLLAGRRDKYMFHQANIVPADDLDDAPISTLEYWYKRVLEEFSRLISFPVKTVKFDDLCSNFQLHEALDSSAGYATMTVEEDGSISDITYQPGSGGAGLVPLTVPTASAASIPVTSLSSYQHASETYGTDTTYYLADSADDIPTLNSQPDVSELPPIPEIVNGTEVAMAVDESPAEVAQREEDNEVAIEENEEAANNKGFVYEEAEGVLPVSDASGVTAGSTQAPTISAPGPTPSPA